MFPEGCPSYSDSALFLMSLRARTSSMSTLLPSMKRILLISYNFAPELTGIGKYNGEMIEWLVTRGYDCSVLTAYPYYPDWRVQGPYRARRFWYSAESVEATSTNGRLTVYRCPTYIPGKPSGVKRMMLDV